MAESVLTGQSQPVDKTVDGLDDADLPLGDRTNMLHMNTCPRVVTATGMNTEIGAIATLPGEAGGRRTPLRRRIDQHS